MADRSGIIKLTNTIGAIVNPATEETLQSVAGFNIPAYDYISATYPTAVQEVYVYKTGGAGGTTVSTVTVNYTDATKAYISNTTKV